MWDSPPPPERQHAQALGALHEADNRDFPPVVSLRGSQPCWKARPSQTCRVASVVTVAGDLAVGVGAAGLLPRSLTVALAILMNLTFMLVIPKRIVAFIVAAFGLLVLTTARATAPHARRTRRGQPL